MKLEKIIIPFVIIAVVVVAYFAYRAIRKNEKKVKAQNEADDRNAEIQDRIMQDSQNMIAQRTITEEQARSIAAKLYNAMSGWGTDEDAIYDAFAQIPTYADLCFVQECFLERAGGAQGTLADWLSDDLSALEIRKVNKILADKGIAYSF